MIRKTALPLILLALIGGAQCASAQDLPGAAAETLDGKKLDFPAALHGSAATCVFGFGKDSSDKVGVWLESLTGDNINAWSVVNLEPTPPVARTAIRLSMRKSTPTALRGRSLIVSKVLQGVEANPGDSAGQSSRGGAVQPGRQNCLEAQRQLQRQHRR